MLQSHFPFLRSDEAEEPKGVWAWAKRLVEALQRSKLIDDLIDTPTEGKEHYIVRVNADGTGYEIDKEVLHSLIGVSLVGKAGQFVKVNATEDGFTIAS